MIWAAIVLASVAAGWLLGRGDAAANLHAASSSAPEHLLLTLLGVSVGLYGRDRIRLRRTYASPTVSYTGKLLLVAAFSLSATFVLAPVDWSASWLAVFAAGGAGGTALWLSNLPLRL